MGTVTTRDGHGTKSVAMPTATALPLPILRSFGISTTAAL